MGKTTVALGIALNAVDRGAKVGYMKPLGDRIIYDKKGIYDADAGLFAELLDLGVEASELTVTFDWRDALGSEGVHGHCVRVADRLESGIDVMMVESAEAFCFGGTVGMDSGSMASALDADVILLTGGKMPEDLDRIRVAKAYYDSIGVHVVGLVLNAIAPDMQGDVDDVMRPIIEHMGIPILGTVAMDATISRATVGSLTESLNAKVVAGQDGMDRTIENVFVGALSAISGSAMPAFHLPNKVIITGGDRSDMILASLESEASAVVLTNNLLPPTRIMNMADDLSIPLISVPMDTFSAAEMVRDMTVLTHGDDDEKIEAIKKAVTGLDVSRVLGV